MSTPSLLCLLLFTFCASASALDRQLVLRPAASASALVSASGYSYIGCWNETTGFESQGGARALGNGKSIVRTSMTIETCIEYCSAGQNNGIASQYVGLSKGRECRCSAHLSSLSERLDESARCTRSCSGNSSQLCGGSAAITLYNLTDEEPQTGIAWSQFSGAAGYGTLAVITLAIAAVM